MNILDLLKIKQQQQDPTRGTGHVFNPYGNPTQANMPRPQQKTSWSDAPALGGMASKGDLLLASMGMLSGKTFQEGMGNALPILGAGMQRTRALNKEQEDKFKLARAMVSQGVDKKKAAFYTMLGPQGAASMMTSDRGFEYQKGQDQTANDLARARLDQTTEYQNAMLGLKREELDQEAEIEKAKLEAKLKTGMPLKFSDLAGVRERNEKRYQGFETAQRNYLTMSKLANDGTGASDVALGFAFFKTIDPTSTVREGEFAQAATAQGLGNQMVSVFRRLDKGEKFSPQLRQDLVNAAGRAYQEQVTDIQRLNERETTFASQVGLDPSLITRDPVRGSAPSAGDNSNMVEAGDIPEGALVRDPDTGQMLRMRNGQLVPEGGEAGEGRMPNNFMTGVR